jgi:oligopeptide transport system ATP-binding protein
MPLLEVSHLTKRFTRRRGWFGPPVVTTAVDDVSFAIDAGETFGLVGESGCGKTTLGRSVLRLIEPTAGTINFAGRDITSISHDELRPLRRKMQIIFQDPFGSLNPRMPVSDIIGEGLFAQGMKDHKARDKKVEDSLELVGLRREYTRRYPHEFSGGQRQRIGIARALALGPDIVVCDEPVSALDVSIQAQVVNLFMELQERLSLTYLFIAHDLAVVRHVCDRIAVMYLGRIVEIARRDELYKRPLHPYTEALLAAIPVADPEVEARRPRAIVRGEVPSALNPPSGCRFHPRCPRVMDRCKTVDPPLIDLGAGRSVACHLHTSPPVTG